MRLPKHGFQVKSPLVNGGVIRTEVDPPLSLATIFKSSFSVEYGIDVTGVPEAILAIPGLVNLAPLAWIHGLDLHVPVIEAGFLQSLRRVKTKLASLFPQYPFAGEIHAQKVVEVEQTGSGAGLLFSGGVDSLAALVRRREEKPLLITVWGAEIRLDQKEEWDQLAGEHARFAQRQGLGIEFVRSNLRTFFQPPHPKWWGGIQHGMGLLGLTAPLAYQKGLGKIYLSGTFSDDSLISYGSHPEIIGNLAWSGTQAVLDTGLSRLEKLELLVEYMRREDPEFQLRVCLGSSASNCSRCYKCVATMIGLALLGEDPNRHGFCVDRFSLEEIKTDSAKLNAPISVWLTYQDLPRYLDRAEGLPLPGWDEFLVWLGEFYQEKRPK